MNTIAIITIVVVALLTVIIFGLTWLAFGACLKSYRLEVSLGKHDDEIRKEYQAKKKKKGGLLGIICSYVVLSALLGLFVTGIVYKASGENFTINNQTVLVIKTGSMSGFYDEEIALQYNNDTSLQFDIGDICVFNKMSEDSELVEGEVYGYKYNDIIITHRLEKIHETGYEFRGDNNPVSDYEYTRHLVKRDEIVYHYTGKKVPGLGAFILYAQSYFGLWSLSGIVGVAISTEIVYHIVDKINKERNKLLSKPQRKIKAQFKRRDGTEVIIYEKRMDN